MIFSVAVPLLLVGLILPSPATCTKVPDSSTTGLKFGETAKDYVVFKPAMEPLEESFSVCGWVKKLRSSTGKWWFAYSSSASPYRDIMIEDAGYTFIFNTVLDMRSKITASLGEWKHFCVSWSLSSRAFRFYYEGELIGTKETASGKKLPIDGYMVLGNEFDSFGGGFADDNAFGGELFKINVFNKELTGAEIKEMKDGGICSELELGYGRTRYLKWSDFLLEERSGNVTEIDVGCDNESSRWDILSTSPFLNKPLTQDMIDSLRSGWDILGRHDQFILYQFNLQVQCLNLN